MPPRKNDKPTGEGAGPLVDETPPGALEEALASAGEAVAREEDSATAGLDLSEAGHTRAIDSMEALADQLQLDTSTMVYGVRDFLLETIKVRPKPWSATSQAEQRDVAAACEHAANEVVRKIVEAVAARGTNPVRVLLTKVTLGADMVIAGKVKTFDPEEENRAVDTLHKAIGKHVILTVASADDFKNGERPAQTDADEPDLDFEAGGSSEDDDAE